MYAYEARIFEERCRELARAVRARGAILRKLPEHAIAIDVRGESVAFPVASDDRDWLLTTPEEAFYAAMLDAEALGPDCEDRARTLGAFDTSRIRPLAELLGGKAAFVEILRAGGFLNEAESRFRR